MSEEINQRWAIKTPEGGLRNINLTAARAISEFIEAQTESWYSWKWYSKNGWSCVKVWLYEEPRENCNDCGVYEYRPAGCKSKVRG